VPIHFAAWCPVCRQPLSFDTDTHEFTGYPDRLTGPCPHAVFARVTVEHPKYTAREVEPNAPGSFWRAGNDGRIHWNIIDVEVGEPEYSHFVNAALADRAWQAQEQFQQMINDGRTNPKLTRVDWGFGEAGSFEGEVWGEKLSATVAAFFAENPEEVLAELVEGL